ncbi:MAG: hypothetical protein V4805_07710 [Pseudomonadota bacterium]
MTTVWIRNIALAIIVCLLSVTASKLIEDRPRPLSKLEIAEHQQTYGVKTMPPPQAGDWQRNRDQRRAAERAGSHNRTANDSVEAFWALWLVWFLMLLPGMLVVLLIIFIRYLIKVWR